MNRTASFDTIAETYDSSFSESLTGKVQRMQSRKHLLKFLSGKSNLNILEINCGTGEDALWLASLGHTVTATDQSAGMIRIANNKICHPCFPNLPSFIQCGFEEIEKTIVQQQFDLIFSNFSGLNCVSAEKLTMLGRVFESLLKEEGRLAVVLFGKYTLWELVYYLLKANFSKATRRWSNKETNVLLTGETTQPVHYYSTARFSRLIKPFQQEVKKPIGVLTPPSYLESAMQKRPRLFRFLTSMDNYLCRYSALSSLADHSFLLFKKQPA